MTSIKPLAAEQLFTSCDPAQFPFETTAELDVPLESVGQERATAAVEFGIGIQQKGYNLYVLGPTGAGKKGAVMRALEEKAAAKPVPSDWCYVQNFEHNHQPRALKLPAGKGSELAEDMKNLVEALFSVIPAAFESEEYHKEKQAINEEVQHQQEEELEELAAKATEQNIALMRTPAGLAFAPMREGKIMSPDDFQELPEKEQQEIQAKIAERQDDLQKIIRQMPQLSRESREKVKALNQEVVSFAVNPLIDELREKYDGFDNVLAYLDAVQQDISQHVDQFIEATSQQQSILAQLAGGKGELSTDQPQDGSFFNRYRINVLIDQRDRNGAPIIYEDYPTHPNLVGRVEHVAQMGALLTDFTLIKPGALHRANGGYLLVDVRRLLSQPYAYESLKRSLRAGEIHIESLGQALSLISTVALEPEPIPLNLKVVLLGERLLYYLLYQYDPEFGDLFKVAADFEDEIPRENESSSAYARLVSTVVRRHGLRHLQREAVARVVEFASRQTGDAERLTTHMQTLTDLLEESSYWAGEAGHEFVRPADVKRAIEAQRYRGGRLRERMQEMILRDTVLIDTSGAKVGQINGLAVLQVGSTTFGRPNRITAQVRLGKGEVVDIERQVEMGGPIHSKGVLILAGFLGGRYAAERPLSISASLVFEQSYSGVEGDSASSAELYALLSTLAGAPLKQSLAVTGSVNQHGEVQAIGGVNDKIEGFFDICQARGLTGDQGVLIPAANVKNLMLREDVVEAARDGRFQIFPVSTIDEGMEILTGIPAGKADEEGGYPPDTLNGRVAARLEALVEKQKELQRSMQGVSES